MKEIKLTRGKVALVDDEDYEWLRQYSWYARGNKEDVCERGREKRLRNRLVAATTIKVPLPNGINTYLPMSMHRLVMKAKPNQLIDHIDGNPLNNQKSNLRFATNQQNSWNARGAKTFKGKPTSSRFKGVFKKVCKTKHGDYTYYVGRIGVNGKDITLYHGKDEVAAACHYDYGAQHYFGEYARCNFDGAAYDEWYNENYAND